MNSVPNAKTKIYTFAFNDDVSPHDRQTLVQTLETCSKDYTVLAEGRTLLIESLKGPMPDSMRKVLEPFGTLSD